MKRAIIIFIISLIAYNARSQVVTKLSFDPAPKSRGIFEVSTNQPIENIQVDLSQITDTDPNTPGPFQFGKGIETSFNLSNSGKWFEHPNGRVWKLQITSPKAYSLNLIFNKLYLPENAQLFVYNPGRTMVFGPVTSKNNRNSNTILTDIIGGESIILELYEPMEVLNQSILEIRKVIHGYKNVIPTLFGDADPCQIDINCDEGDPFQDQSDGVALILLSSGTTLASGALLNNACQDFTPYILTAFHVLDTGNGNCLDQEYGNRSLSSSEISEAEDYLFRFQYKSPCNGPEPSSSTYFSFQGSTFRSAWPDTDFALLEMAQRPDASTEINYLGWTTSTNAPVSGAFVGHPIGDVMKISLIDDAESNSNQITFTFCSGLKNYSVPSNSHWSFDVTDGGLEGGSSGGPLLDQNGRVVGQMHGGIVDCAPTIGYAGRFDVSWTGGGTATTRLSTLANQRSKRNAGQHYTHPFHFRP